MATAAAKYYYISDELAELFGEAKKFGEAKGRRMSGNEIEINMQNYVRRCGLQNGLSICIDNKLAKLCNIQDARISHIRLYNWVYLKK